MCSKDYFFAKRINVKLLQFLKKRKNGFFISTVRYKRNYGTRGSKNCFLSHVLELGNCDRRCSYMRYEFKKSSLKIWGRTKITHNHLYVGIEGTPMCLFYNNCPLNFLHFLFHYVYFKIIRSFLQLKETTITDDPKFIDKILEFLIRQNYWTKYTHKTGVIVLVIKDASNNNNNNNK